MKVDKKRVRLIHAGSRQGKGAVMYWMNRELRIADNWALLYAAERAKALQRPLTVLYNLDPSFLSGGSRQHLWKVRSLQEIENILQRKNITLHLVVGKGVRDITSFIKKHDIAELITDFSPLRVQRAWIADVQATTGIPFYEVDAHNIVPAWYVSEKQEYGAYTLRPKIHKLLPLFLTEFPTLQKQQHSWQGKVVVIDWGRIEKAGMQRDPQPVDMVPGMRAAENAMEDFFNNRFTFYAEKRNDPTQDAQSNLSPYLHYGNIAPQRVVLEAQKYERGNLHSYESFIEELVVRRELSDNFCLYNSEYDAVTGFPDWAQTTLNEHRSDEREFLYAQEEFEHAQTHDALWNAAQQQMLLTGKMHGYMRMYWAKKILEWTESPEQAMQIAIYLNDRYELDGRDPNGYAGIAWSIGGVHDRAWGERPVFGKIRYMNEKGCRRKFDVDAYIAQWGPQGALL